MNAVQGESIVLSIDGLSKRYGSVHAVDNLSFVIRKGETVGLIGPNGAGKTTVLKCLAGLVRPDKGSIAGNEASMFERPPHAGSLSFLYEIDALPNDMSVKSFLMAEAFARSLGKAEVETVVQEVALDSMQNKTIRSLSMGNRRRVGIAAALLPRSDLLVLDEPTNGLDLEGLRLIRNIISEQKYQGKSVLFSSHTMSEVEKVADRVIVIKDGVKRFDGSIEVLKKSTSVESLEEAYEQVMTERMS